jgi:ATP-dependent Clp protease protease subunit
MREKEFQSSTKALAQRQLRRNYSQDYSSSNSMLPKTKSQNYLNSAEDASYLEYRDYYRKQTERTLQDEESKKVFMIINSFGGSVGNGITVHDALQFIKAGSMTLALGVAASAASLALAGGTIGERYVTEGCHVMIHQPESGLSGQASDIWIDSQEIMKIRLDVAEIYSLSTYRPRHKILRDLDRDFYLTATETIHYGLADEIATNETLHEIIEMTNKVWDYHDAQQQKLLETRESLNSGMDTQTQN